jgi:glycosyltransferase involved in cell wall biosynthesis
MRVLAFTMVYNESENISRWLDHYQRQLGPDATLIVDNASDDDSVPLIRRSRNLLYPKMVFSNNLRAAFCSSLAASMLLLHDVVIYTDVDEFIVADPAKYANLSAFLEQNTASAYSCLGFDLLHMIGEEPECPPDQPLLSYRRHAKPIRSMCKTLITRRPIRWGGGFHTSDAYPIFHDDLWLFHTKSANFGQRLRRQAITRKVVRDDNSGEHQRWDDDKLRAVFEGIRKIRRERFDAQSLGRMRTQLEASIQRRYYDQADIIKYAFDAEAPFDDVVLRLDADFPPIF